MSVQRLSVYEILLLSNPSLQIKYAAHTSGPAPILNALLGLKGPEDHLVEIHDCIHAIQHRTLPHSDLSSIPIEGAPEVFVDGSCSRPNDNSYHAGYSVVMLPDIVLKARTIT